MGTGLQEYPQDKLGDRRGYRGQTMFESTGSAYSSFLLRPWDPRITDAMIQAGVEAGYGSDRAEADAQRGFWAPDLDPLAGRLWRGRTRFYTAQYGYAPLPYPSDRPGGGLGGSRRRPAEGAAADRKRILAGPAHLRLSGETGSSRSPGTTSRPGAGPPPSAAGAASNSWEKQERFLQGILYPQTEGRDSYLVAVDKEASRMLDSDPEVLLSNLRNQSGIDAEAVETFVRAGPEILVVLDRRNQADAAGSSRIRHGIGFRFRIPYRRPQLVDLRLNGHALVESPVDGYQSWFGNGFTQVQVNVPPEKAKALRIFILTIAYRPDVTRSYGWTPPRAVLERRGRSSEE